MTLCSDIVQEDDLDAKRIEFCFICIGATRRVVIFFSVVPSVDLLCDSTIFPSPQLAIFPRSLTGMFSIKEL
jgi:hypothetical protein